MRDTTAQEIEIAWAAYERGEAGQAGIVDHVSFQVMRRLGLTQALTNDRHFLAAGFQQLLGFSPWNPRHFSGRGGNAFCRGFSPLSL
jgi:hypothetical protein